jgi:hypothetical protein
LKGKWQKGHKRKAWRESGPACVCIVLCSTFPGHSPFSKTCISIWTDVDIRHTLQSEWLITFYIWSWETWQMNYVQSCVWIFSFSEPKSNKTPEETLLLYDWLNRTEMVASLQFSLFHSTVPNRNAFGSDLPNTCFNVLWRLKLLLWNVLQIWWEAVMWFNQDNFKRLLRLALQIIFHWKNEEVLLGFC